MRVASRSEQPIYQLPKGEKVGAWDNWLKAMMMDVRLGDSDRAILTAIAQHYNLDTGDCFPSQGRVAIEVGYGKAETGETGRKAVIRTVIKAVKLGWLKSISRRGGKKNQTNLYELTLPESIRDVLANVGPELTITGAPGAWLVLQATDGVAIGGPFKDRTNAERWIAEHGPMGQIAPLDGTKDRVSMGHNDVPENREVNRTEKRIESSTAPFSLRSRLRSNGSKKRKVEFEEIAGSAFNRTDIEYVQGLLLSEGGPGAAMTIQKIVAMSREGGAFPYPINSQQIAAMADAGYLQRHRDSVWVSHNHEALPPAR